MCQVQLEYIESEGFWGTSGGLFFFQQHVNPNWDIPGIYPINADEYKVYMMYMYTGLIIKRPGAHPRSQAERVTLAS